MAKHLIFFFKSYHSRMVISDRHKYLPDKNNRHFVRRFFVKFNQVTNIVSCL